MATLLWFNLACCRQISVGIPSKTEKSYLKFTFALPVIAFMLISSLEITTARFQNRFKIGNAKNNGQISLHKIRCVLASIHSVTESLKEIAIKIHLHDSNTRDKGHWNCLYTKFYILHYDDAWWDVVFSATTLIKVLFYICK